MALKIRMRQQGRTNRPFYRVIVIDSKSRRDGEYIECIGWYNPCEQDEEKVLSIKPDRLQHWLEHGAELSERAEHLATKAAPAVVKAQKEKFAARDAKATAKKRERRKAAAAASK